MNLLFALALAAFPNAAAAEPAIRVEVDAAASARLDVPEMARALGAELDTEVRLDGAAPARVVVLAERGDTVIIRYEDDHGAHRERSVALPGEPAESTRIVVLLVSNLARDQVGALVVPTATEPEDTDGAALADAASPSVPVAPADPPARVGAAEPEAPAAGPRPKRPPAERDFHLGLGVTGGVAGVDGTAAPFFLWGAEIGWEVAPHLNIGMARITAGVGVSSDDGATAYVHGTPYAELSGFVGTRLEPFARAGVLVRSKSDTNVSPGWFEAAPYLGGGARFYATPALAFGLEVGVNLVVTEELTLGSARLPQFSVPGAIGLSTTLHF